MANYLHIQGGTLYDPANGADGQQRDIWMLDGVVCEPPTAEQQAAASVSVVDAAGAVVMPGAVEMHSHLASTTVNAARKIQSESGYHAVVPTAADTGRLYAQLGYTTGIEAAVPPMAAGLAHMQLDDLPHLDTGLLLLLGNHEALVDLMHEDRAAAIGVVQQLLQQTGAFGIKAVNPAAVARWRRDASKHAIHSIDDQVDGTKVSPRTMLELLTEAAEELNLAHPTHIHGPQLGEPGAVEITLDMLRALAGRRCHLAHLQYYAYANADQEKSEKGGGANSYVSAVDTLLNYLSDHPEVTADLGLVAFGPAFTATADMPLEHGLYRNVAVPGKPAYFLESGNEDCFGVMPLLHQPGNPSTAIQWATGLELALQWDNPWQFALTIDHPNGGSFQNYPTLIAMLMSKARRDEQLEQCHAIAKQRTGLAGIEREMTLNDIAIITRAAPAKALGLADKGHLGVGADGDVTVYENNVDDPEAMFRSPRTVIKAGQRLVDKGVSLLQQADASATRGRRLTASLSPSDRGAGHLQQWLDAHDRSAVSRYGAVGLERSHWLAVS